MKCPLLSLLLVLLAASSLHSQVSDYEVGDHNLLIMPTAYTMPKGKAYFSDYELFFLDFQYAPTGRSQIGAFLLFPITSEFINTLTFQYKQNYLNTNKFGSAFWATFNPKSKFFTLGNVISIGDSKNNLNIAINGLNVIDDDIDNHGWFLMFMGGFQTRISRKTSFMIEYMNFGYTDDDILMESSGFFTLGFRFRSQSMSWEIGGIRPMDAQDSDLFLLPLLKATVMLN